MADTTTPQNVRQCPICKSQASAAYLPFCSKRCADIDLGKWFTNAYAIPGAPDEDEATNPLKSGDDEEERGQ